MAALTDIKIVHETRLCKVGKQFGYFHCWEQFVGAMGSSMWGIVELPDGVKRIPPNKIKFCDDDHKFLCDLNKYEEEREEKTEE